MICVELNVFYHTFLTLFIHFYNQYKTLRFQVFMYCLIRFRIRIINPVNLNTIQIMELTAATVVVVAAPLATSSELRTTTELHLHPMQLQCAIALYQSSECLHRGAPPLLVASVAGGLGTECQDRADVAAAAGASGCAGGGCCFTWSLRCYRTHLPITIPEDDVLDCTV